MEFEKLYGFRFFITGQRSDGLYGVKDLKDKVTQFYSYNDIMYIVHEKNIKIQGVNGSNIDTEWFKGHFAMAVTMLADPQKVIERYGVWLFEDGILHPCHYMMVAKNGNELTRWNDSFVEFIESIQFCSIYRGFIEKTYEGNSRAPFKSKDLKRIEEGLCFPRLKDLKPSDDYELVGAYSPSINKPIVLGRYQGRRYLVECTNKDVLTEATFARGNYKFLALIRGRTIVIDDYSFFNFNDDVLFGRYNDYELFISKKAMFDIMNRNIKLRMYGNPAYWGFETEVDKDLICRFLSNNVNYSGNGDSSKTMFNIKVFFGHIENNVLNYDNLGIYFNYHYINSEYVRTDSKVNITAASLGFWFKVNKSDSLPRIIDIGKKDLKHLLDEPDFEKNHNISKSNFMRLVKE